MPYKFATISDEKLNELCERIKPVARFVFGEKSSYNKRGLYRSANGFLHYLEIDDPHKKYWAEYLTPAHMATGLERWDRIHMFFPFSMGGLSVSTTEVLAQIPEVYSKRICAFEVDWASAHIKDTINYVIYEADIVLYCLYPSPD